MKTVLRNDPRYLLLAVPSVLADSNDAVDRYVGSTLTRQKLFDEGDYFIMPLDQTSLYQEAVEAAKKNAVSRGFECELIDGRNAIIRVRGRGACNDHHLRVVFVGSEQTEECRLAH